MKFESVNKLVEKSIRDNWERPSLSNYKGETLCFKDVARKIEKMHILFELCGIKQGDKVAISSRNQANWVVCFFSALTYGAVPVPLLHEFKSGTVHHLVNHCEARVLFVDEVIWDGLDSSEMPDLKLIVQVNQLSVLESGEMEPAGLKEKVNEVFAERFPDGLKPDMLNYHEDAPEELAVINYTSGTSGFSKGVMLPYRAFYSNIELSRIAEPQLNNTMNVVSMLPSAHMYGLMYEVFYEFLIGAHVHFLSRVSPAVILAAMSEIKPDLVVAVPLIIEKVYKGKVKPVIEKAPVKYLIRIPLVNRIIYRKVRQQLIDAFGGRFEEVIIGGAALNKEVEEFFHKIRFPYTVGYGMTECAPIIGYSHWNKTKLFSCGKLAPNLEARIDSPDPVNVPGELMLKGANVFQGYYRNPEVTEAAFTKDGWFRTGDMGVIDKDGYLFLRGRNKCMILGPSGQNIYPEEIEGIINNVQYVVESLVIEDAGALTALVFPDYKAAEAAGLSGEALQKHLAADIAEASKALPAFSRVKNVVLMAEDFERTPKKSIKRYLYQKNN